MNNKTMVKLIWTLVAIVLLAGVMRLAMVHKTGQSGDDKVLNRKAK